MWEVVLDLLLNIVLPILLPVVASLAVAFGVQLLRRVGLEVSTAQQDAANEIVGRAVRAAEEHYRPARSAGPSKLEMATRQVSAAIPTAVRTKLFRTSDTRSIVLAAIARERAYGMLGAVAEKLDLTHDPDGE